MCSTRHLKLLATITACATALGTSANAAAAEPSYEMISYMDSPSGLRLEAGDFDGAVDLALPRLRRGDTQSRLMENTNLCVAYTAIGSYSKAGDACETALTLAKRFDRDYSTRGVPDASETAKAMTNRGVLRAMTGDMAGAANDFQEATAMSDFLRVPDRNLAYLEVAVIDRVAMTGAR